MFSKTNILQLVTANTNLMIYYSHHQVCPVLRRGDAAGGDRGGDVGNRGRVAVQRAREREAEGATGRL